MDQQVQHDLRQQINKVLDVIKGDLATVRTGKASPVLVENIVVNVYGGTTRLKIMELATVGVVGSSTLVITPFDKSIIEEIRKGIQEANVGMNPSVDGQVIRINLPPLSQERRQELTKLMNHKIENGRIMIRQVRHKTMEDLKKKDLPEDDEKRLEKEVQKIVDESIEQLEEMGKQKEEELMQI